MPTEAAQFYAGVVHFNLEFFILQPQIGRGVFVCGDAISLESS
jgi:hypothetical protein